MCPSDGRHAERRVDLDPVLSALSHSSRRRILSALMDDNPRHQREVERVAVDPTDGARETGSTELHHNHLPRLDEDRFIDWDRETGEISKGPNWDAIASLLQLIQDNPDELPDGVVN